LAYVKSDGLLHALEQPHVHQPVQSDLLDDDDPPVQSDLLDDDDPWIRTTNITPSVKAAENTPQEIKRSRDRVRYANMSDEAKKEKISRRI